MFTVFTFKSDDPLERIKEFGSSAWVKSNAFRIALIACVYLMVGFKTYGHPFADVCFGMAFVPVLAFIFIGSFTVSRMAIGLQNFWYLPVLFYKARHKRL